MQKRKDHAYHALLESKYLPYFLIIVVTLFQLLLLIKYFHYPLTNDEMGYREMAMQLLSGEKFAPYWPPGLPMYTGIFYMIFGTDTSIGRLALFLLYPVFLIYLYLLTVRLSNKRAGLLVLLFIAVYPAFKLYSIIPMTEMLASVCLITLLYYLVCYIESGKYVYLIVTGIFTGLLILTRPSSALIVLVLFGFLFLIRKKLVPALIPALIAVLIVFGWIGYCYNMTGKFVPVNYANSFNIFLGNNEHAPLYKMWPPVPDKYFDDLQNEKDKIAEQYDIEERDAVYKDRAIHHIKERPDLFLLRTFNRVKVYFSFDSQTAAFFKANYGISSITTVLILGAGFVMFMFSMVFFIAALFNWRKLDMKKPYFMLLCSVILAYSLPYFISFSFNRFNVPILPLIVILALVCFQGMLGKRDGIQFWSLFKLKSKKSIWFMVSLLFLAYIQVEFVYFMIGRF